MTGGWESPKPPSSASIAASSCSDMIMECAWWGWLPSPARFCCCSCPAVDLLPLLPRVVGPSTAAAAEAASCAPPPVFGVVWCGVRCEVRDIPSTTHSDYWLVKSIDGGWGKNADGTHRAG